MNFSPPSFRVFSIIAGLSLLSLIPPAHAFGIGDIVGVALEAGGKIGGALIDKAVDSMKDPAEEERKRKEAQEQQDLKMRQGFEKALSDIETSPHLKTPYQREKAKVGMIEMNAQVAAFSKFAQEMQRQQELKQRQDRDKLLSFGGIASTIGSAALNSPSSIMSQTNQLSKSSDFRRGIADASAGRINPTTALLAPLHAAQASNKIDTALADVQEQLKPVAQAMERTAEETKEQLNAVAEAKVKTPSIFFAADLGKPIYVEYIGHPEETRRLREMLASQGHILAETATDAVGYYRIEGEYSIPSSNGRHGLELPIETVIKSPESVKTPALKEKSLMENAISGAFSLLNANKQTEEPAPKPILQLVFLVASREAAGSQEVRVSVKRKLETLELKPAYLIEDTTAALYGKLGLLDEVPDVEIVKVGSGSL